MRHFRVFMTILLATIFLTACLGGNGRQVSETGTLKLRLVDEQGRPFKGDALITLGAKDEHVTGLEEYSFAQLKAGSLRIIVKAIGYEDYNEDVTIEAERVTNKTIQLIKRAVPTGKGTLKGFIFEDDSGGPHVSVPVTISLEQNGTAVRTGTFSRSVFEFNELPAGYYSLKASAPGYQDYRSEQELEIVAGEETNFFILLRRDPDVPLPGSVGGFIFEGELIFEEEEEDESPFISAASNGLILGPVNLVLQKDGETISSGVFENGTYEFTSLTPGNYLLNASAEIYHDYAAEIEIEAGQAKEHHIKLERNLSLLGSLKVDVLEFGSGGNYVREPVKVTLEQNGEVITEEILNNGQYIFTGLLPGDYHVTITATGFRTLVIQKQINSGTETPCLVLLTRESPAEPVRLDGSIFRGETEQSVTEVVTITLIQAGNVLEQADFENGVYSFLNLNAGTYLLTAIADGYENYSAEIELTAEGDARHDIRFRIVSVPGDNEPIFIADPRLEQAIRDSLRKQEGQLTKADVSDIRKFYQAAHGVESLEGMQHFINLEEFQITYGQIIDLSPLAGLTKLKRLMLWDQQIDDLSPLANLTNLERIIVFNNQISDISPLAGLTKLDYLDLDNNQVSDLEPLANLTRLDFLGLSHNQVKNLSPLSGLINLRTLKLDHNKITNLGPLLSEDLSALQNLDIAGNQLDYSPGSSALQQLTILQGRLLSVRY